ncbi:MAG: hypothetical protein K1X71_12630 [Pirellulales bacterium]|nr:hypothetical protein [Pirellulales bacterium]
MALPQRRAVLDNAVRPTTRRGPSTGQWQCLIIAPNDKHRRELVDAATEAGWVTVDCRNPQEALDCQQRLLFQLALVDLASRNHVLHHALRDAAATLSQQSGALLVVCGEGSADEEIWARQLGAWLYLPGVVEGGELASLFGEARELAARLSAPQGAAWGGAPVWQR